MTNLEMTESALNWHCPLCRGPRHHVECDGCHFLTCSECSYPCACGDGDPDDCL